MKIVFEDSKALIDASRAELDNLAEIYAFLAGSPEKKLEGLFYYFRLHHRMELFDACQQAFTPEPIFGGGKTKYADWLFIALLNTPSAANDLQHQILAGIEKVFLTACIQAGVLSIEDLVNRIELIRWDDDRQPGKTE